ncbi:S41 family peptidase [Alloiococcus sp. CFN-8]|uniref:S41 family peptidase n=1 Tax=Alloiococcus sp. CFN-8 TaxID=3416081 RepID=UPI003CF959F1
MRRIKSWVAVFLIVIITVIFVGCDKESEEPLSQEAKLEDFNYMYQVIKEGYPFLDVNKRLNDVDWLAYKDTYEEWIKETEDDEAFIAALEKILLGLNNGHTHIIPKDGYLNFHLIKKVYGKLGWFDCLDNETVLKRYGKSEEEVVITNNEDSNSSTLNAELKLMDAVEGKVGYMYLPQMGRIGVPLEEDMNIIKEYIKKLDNYQALIIDIRGNSGGNDLYWASIVSMLIDKDMKHEGYSLYRGGAVIDDYVEKREFKISDVDEFISLQLEDVPEEVAKDFNSYTKVEDIIEANKVGNFKGNIYLLVDGWVFSSSESFSIFVKDTGFATLIGEKTGGDGGGTDPVLFDLPNSGLLVRMSSQMFLTSNGVCNEEYKTTPDYIIEDTTLKSYFGDFKNDNCVQKVLELEKINIKN